MNFIIPSSSSNLWFCQLWYVCVMVVDTWTVSFTGIKHESEHIVLLSLLYKSSCCVYTAEFMYKQKEAFSNSKKQ